MARGVFVVVDDGLGEGSCVSGSCVRVRRRGLTVGVAVGRDCSVSSTLFHLLESEHPFMVLTSYKRELYTNSQIPRPRKSLPAETISAIPSSKSTRILPFVKLAKNSMNMLIIRRALGTIPIPIQRIDMLTGIDIAPARGALVGPILERFPAAALPRLVEADGTGVVVASVEWGVVGGAEDVLAERVEAVQGVGDGGGEGDAVAELEHRSSNAFLQMGMLGQTVNS